MELQQEAPARDLSVNYLIKKAGSLGLRQRASKMPIDRTHGC